MGQCWAGDKVMQYFTKYHIGIARKRFMDLLVDGHYDTAKRSKDLTLHKIPFNKQTAKHWIKMVGGDYQWDKRSGLENELYYIQQNKSKFYMLRKNETDIGICITVKPPYGGRFIKPSTEQISFFGLLPSETGKTYGSIFLAKIFATLFSSNKNIYLATRDTNHAKVVPFYEGMGMAVLGSEKLVSDIQNTVRLKPKAA